MKKTRKVSLGVVITSVAVLMIMASPGVLAITPNNALLESYTGHSLSEPSWAIVYDVVGNHLMQNLTPGPYNSSLSAGLNNTAPDRQANFYITYMNMGQVQTLYMADVNLTADISNYTLYGCSPYQLLIEHFKTQGNMEVFVVNAFMGLLAYQNSNATQLTPNANSQLYMGWTEYSQLYKALVDQGLARSGVPKYDLYGNDTTTTGTPIPLQHSIVNGTNGTENQYTYGMSYSNVFVVWQQLNVTAGLNNTGALNQVNVVNNVAAVSMLSSLNFTYTVTGYNSTSGLTNVTTTTKYDIGQLHNLWIVGDNQSVASYFGGYNFTYHPGIFSSRTPIALYNTSASIAARLQGNTSTPGYSVAVANYANIIPIATKPPAQSLRDQNGTTINPLQSRNMTRAQFMLTVRNKAVKAFEINTAQTNQYTLNGSTSLTAISCIVPNTRLNSPIASSMYWMAHGFIVNIFKALFPQNNDLQNLQQASRILVGKESLFYLTCFPQWNGESIVNDPTFTVFAGSGTSLGLSIPGYSTIAIAFVSVAAVIGIILVKRKRIKR